MNTESKIKPIYGYASKGDRKRVVSLCHGENVEIIYEYRNRINPKGFRCLKCNEYCKTMFM